MAGRREYREAQAEDAPAITVVRTSVRENHLSVAQLAERGITEASIVDSFRAYSKGWVALDGETLVGFSIADRKSNSIFALFVLPGLDGQGVGSNPLRQAVDWLWENGAERIWLETRRGTRAEHFYRRRGWRQTGIDEKSNVHFELTRP